jgi:protein involved in polysaccharide export with SLBB domain
MTIPLPKLPYFLLQPIFLLVTALCFGQTPIQAPPVSTPPAMAGDAGNSISDYRVGSGDVLEFKFFYNAELNESVQVRPDGKVSLGLIGDVSVEHRILPDIRTEIESRYSSILNRPAVNILVRTFASQKVYVGGEVSRPAAIPLLSDLTAQDAILEVGGAKKTGALSKAILIRRELNGTPSIRTVDLNVKVVGGVPSVGAPIKLQPFDVLLIPETKIARANRWVDEYIRQLVPVTLSGGFSYLFNPIQAVGVK